ncbi:FecR family protein [Novipirellula artificiosorum]|uniref:Uncharacterized protein n=1 Tax=Novipirellula artificiosorum TaxID=2528016 RepID=A0A5C6DB54_9BACT|nr:hypothetical protein [Novipirellula artificiosorum]TWU32977.1 hypothetical protein Poly41_53560 [Novipirellula artificiosorum]
MSILRFAHFVGIASWLAVFAVAQQSDPFAQSSDPFGSAPQQDPFGAAPPDMADDPFGAGTTPHPGNRSSDPFAQPNAHPADPFAAPDRPAPPNQHPSTDLENQIRQTLAANASLVAVEMPLEEMAAWLSREHNVPIVLDRRALEEIGLTPDVPVNLSLRNVSLRSLLKLALRELDLTYVVKNEVLMITTQEAAENNLILRTYVFPAGLADKGDKVVDVLKKTVTPDTWDTLGGSCSAESIDNVLVVSAMEEVHEKVVDFLDKLEVAYRKRLNSP